MSRYSFYNSMPCLCHGLRQPLLHSSPAMWCKNLYMYVISPNNTFHSSNAHPHHHHHSAAKRLCSFGATRPRHHGTLGRRWCSRAEHSNPSRASGRTASWLRPKERTEGLDGLPSPDLGPPRNEGSMNRKDAVRKDYVGGSDGSGYY